MLRIREGINIGIILVLIQIGIMIVIVIILTGGMIGDIYHMSLIKKIHQHLMERGRNCKMQRHGCLV